MTDPDPRPSPSEAEESSEDAARGIEPLVTDEQESQEDSVETQNDVA